MTEQYPDDVEAWIELAQILECNDVQVSQYYFTHSFEDTLQAIPICAFLEWVDGILSWNIPWTVKYTRNILGL